MNRNDGCERCGSFARLTRFDGHLLCADCQERLSRLERTPPTVWNVLVGAVTVLRSAPLLALGLVLAGTLPIYLVRRFVWDVPLIFEWAASVFVQGVMLHVAHRAIREQPIDPRKSVRAAWHAWPRLALVSFVAHLQLIGLALLPAIAISCFVYMESSFALVSTWLLVVLAFGLVMWRAASLAVALPIALHEQPSGSALRASTVRMKKRLAAFVFAVCGLLAFVAPVFGWGALAFAEVLRPDLEAMRLAVEIGTLLASGTLTLVSGAISAVLYAKTVKYRIY